MVGANAWKRRILKRVAPWKRSFVRRYSIYGHRVEVEDATNSMATEFIFREMAKGDYELPGLALNPGDVVVDLGAHVGMFSIALAKRYPGIKVYAYEPTPESFAFLKRNLARNGIDAVHAVNMAVTGDGREVQMWMAADRSNTGGAGLRKPRDATRHANVTVPSQTLDQVCGTHGITRCKLLKVDIEGAEYEVLKSSMVLSRVDYLVGEFHMSADLAAQGHSFEELERIVNQQIPPERVHVERMGSASATL